MHIEQIRIECELSQSTFGGGLKANCKWIGLSYVIILSQSINTWAPSMSYVCETEQREQHHLSARERFYMVIKWYYITRWGVIET